MAMTLEEQLKHCEGKDCTCGCGAYGEFECGCGADCTSAEVYRLRHERDELRDTVKRLNRRAQSAESGVASAAENHKGGSMGRALANSAATAYKHRAETAESELAALKQRMAKLADDLEQKNGTKVFCHIAKLIRRRMQGQP